MSASGALVTSVGLDDPALAQLVTERTRAAGSSFYWGMRLLEPRRRLAMYAVYAFCREVDDIADGNAAPRDKDAGLDCWRSEIDALYAGKPTLALGRALMGPVAEFSLAREDFFAVIDGCAMDGGGLMRRPTMATLDLYCDRVACAVGRLSVRIFGEPSVNGIAVAAALGRALQLTNILRDLREDAQLGRLYLPDEILSLYDIVSDDPDVVLKEFMLPSVCGHIGGLARGYFKEADKAMDACPRQAMRPARLMEAMYRDLLDRMERAHWQVTDARARVPSALKLWYVLRHGLL